MRWIIFFIGWLIFYLFQLVNSLFHLDALAFVLWLVLGGIGTWVLWLFTQIGIEGGFDDKEEKAAYHEKPKTKENNKEDASWSTAAGIITVLIALLIVIGWVIQDYTKTSTQYSTDTQNTETETAINQFGEPESHAAAIPTSKIGNVYPVTVRTAFLNSCYKNIGDIDLSQQQHYCNCLLNYFETNYVMHEFAQIEAEYKRTNQFPSDVMMAASSCAGN